MGTQFPHLRTECEVETGLGVTGMQPHWDAGTPCLSVHTVTCSWPRRFRQGDWVWCAWPLAALPMPFANSPTPAPCVDPHPEQQQLLWPRTEPARRTSLGSSTWTQQTSPPEGLRPYTAVWEAREHPLCPGHPKTLSLTVTSGSGLSTPREESEGERRGPGIRAKEKRGDGTVPSSWEAIASPTSR